jgi:ferredoxin-like protein FixX
VTIEREQWPAVAFDDLIATTEFVPTADGGILFNYEQCFECGTCYLVCNREGAISWSYPEGGFGVVFRRS